MNKTASIILAVIAFLAAGIMYYLGSESSHLSELMDFYYYPIPLGVLGLIGAFKKKS